MDNKRSCFSCRCFNKLRKHSGECRRNSPSIDGWPKVYFDDSCYEFIACRDDHNIENMTCEEPSKEIERLRTALSNVRHSLFASEANVGAITDTLWMAPEISMGETIQDYIDKILTT